MRNAIRFIGKWDSIFRRDNYCCTIKWVGWGILHRPHKFYWIIIQ